MRLNGGRLILYETFGNRRDERLITWVTGLTILYTFFLFFIMYLPNISLASVTLDIALLIGLTMAGAVIIALGKSKMGIYWKIQRISGAFLVIMIPVHLVFMHANPAAGHDSAVILARIRSDMLIRVADFLIVVSALYHGAYGLISIVKDYLKSETLIRVRIDSDRDLFDPVRLAGYQNDCHGMIAPDPLMSLKLVLEYVTRSGPN